MLIRSTGLTLHRWQTGHMGILKRVQQYLGLDPVRVLDDYEPAERSAHLTCQRCGAFVSSTGQALHTDWHRAARS